MPRFAAKLAAALGHRRARRWPELVTLVPPGTKINLAGQVFFQDPAEPPPSGDLLPWLTGVVAETLQATTTVELIRMPRWSRSGCNSMQAIALQYQILQRTGADIAIEDLLGDRTDRRAGRLLARQAAAVRREAEVVV